MVELILILGLLFILGIVILLHILSTSDMPEIRETTNVQKNPSLHPWFFTVEAILLLKILYISKQMY